MKKIIIIICLSILLCGCKNISKEDNIKKLMSENDYVIVDVRTREEYNESHIVEAINIPYDEINESIKLDKNKLIFVYCKSGNRSSIAYNTLNDLGYNVYNLGAYSEINLEKE